MKVGAWVIGALALLVVLFLAAVVIVKIGWPWVIPDLFPGAVAQGLVVARLTWSQAIKLAIVLSAVGAIFFRGSSNN